MDYLNDAVAEAEELVKRFDTRLTNVLAEPNPTPECEDNSDVKLIPLAHELFIFAARLHQFTQNMTDLLGRIQL